jgi:hypothetical protein
MAFSLLPKRNLLLLSALNLVYSNIDLSRNSLTFDVLREREKRIEKRLNDPLVFYFHVFNLFSLFKMAFSLLPKRNLLLLIALNLVYSNIDLSRNSLTFDVLREREKRIEKRVN